MGSDGHRSSPSYAPREALHDREDVITAKEKRTKLVAGGCLAEGCIYPLAARVLSKPPGTTRALAADCLGCSWADQLVDPSHSDRQDAGARAQERLCAD
ncbi:hypothetical protein L1887_58153 [Cichorium endivia]|nr:hypothetical protein L1887_58153 [Cichorium endivia]